MSAVVKIRDVSVSYRENVALKGANLDIEEGSFLCVIGPNGAGKTTLLTVINGLGKIIKGNVKVLGMVLNKRNIFAIRRNIGYVPQKQDIDPRFPITVREVVDIGRHCRIGLLRRMNEADREIVESAMKVVGISELAARPIGHLSGGEQQKVAIARALAQEPKIMLLDEPTSNLDPKARCEIMELINKVYWERRLTIVFVTHLLGHVSDRCRQAVLMKRGRIVWQGNINKALNRKLLADLYECPVEALERDMPLAIN